MPKPKPAPAGAPVPSAARAVMDRIKAEAAKAAAATSEALDARDLTAAAAAKGLTPLQTAFQAARGAFASALVERDEEVDLLLTALLAGEHVLLVGPPGVAKSMLVDQLTGWLGGKTFSLVFNRYTTPEEVFGPVSLQALKEDRYLRVPTGKLPEADFAFLDECFKASSAILNTLLKILNERTWDAGDGIANQVPLQLCLAASNEWPGGEGREELSALFDRFLFRKAVRPVASPLGRQRLLFADDAAFVPRLPKAAASLTPAMLAEARAEAVATGFTRDAQEALLALLTELAKEGVRPGDRRCRKAVKAVRAAAWLAGAAAVEPEHLEVCQHVLWDDPHEHPKAAAKAVARIAAPAGMLAAQLFAEGEAIAAELAGKEKNLGEVTRAVGKIGDILRKLEPLAAKTPRAKTAFDSLAAVKRELAKKSIEAY